MTKKEIITKLESEGIEFDKQSTKSELTKLLYDKKDEMIKDVSEKETIVKDLTKMDPTGIYAVRGGWKVEGIKDPFLDAGEAQMANYKIRHGG